MTTDNPQRGVSSANAAVPEGATADNEVLLDAHQDGHPVVPYKALWGVLLLGWVVSYSDRTLTGPVIAWMIENRTGFIGDASNPATIGGLIGSMFFLGYMLTQYPGGRLGDRYGHREMIIVSLLAAGVLTVVSGLVAGLVAFVAARVLTGLGEGVFYSNDRTLIINHTPVAKRTLGLGIVIVGLSIGLTVGIVCTPLLIQWGESLGMGGSAWRLPFFVFAAFTFIVAIVAFVFFRSKMGGPLRLGPPFVQLLLFSLPTLSFAAAYGIHNLGLGLAWSFLIVGGAYVFVALILLLLAMRKFKRIKPPEKSIASAKETAAVLSRAKPHPRPAVGLGKTDPRLEGDTGHPAVERAPHSAGV